MENTTSHPSPKIAKEILVYLRNQYAENVVLEIVEELYRLTEPTQTLKNIGEWYKPQS